MSGSGVEMTLPKIDPHVSKSNDQSRCEPDIFVGLQCTLDKSNWGVMPVLIRKIVPIDFKLWERGL